MTAELRDAGIAVKYLLRDHDDKFGPGFDAVWESEGASSVRSPVRAPNANAVAERSIRTVRSSGEQRPVGRLERRPVDLAPEDRHLVTEHDDFDRQVRVRPTGEPDQLKDATERPIQEREGHPMMVAASEPCVKVLVTGVAGILGTDRSWRSFPRAFWSGVCTWPRDDATGNLGVLIEVVAGADPVVAVGDPQRVAPHEQDRGELRAGLHLR